MYIQNPSKNLSPRSPNETNPPLTKYQRSTTRNNSKRTTLKIQNTNQSTPLNYTEIESIQHNESSSIRNTSTPTVNRTSTRTRSPAATEVGHVLATPGRLRKTTPHHLVSGANLAMETVKASQLVALTPQWPQTTGRRKSIRFGRKLDDSSQPVVVWMLFSKIWMVSDAWTNWVFFPFVV